jgi:hypothetical protein
MCLNAGGTLQVEPRLSGLRRVAKPALSGLLALLLLICGVISVSRALHQLLHNDAAGSHHLCLACSFAKGQVSTADVTLVSGPVIFFCLCGIRAIKPSPLPGFDYRLSPSRAPPATALRSVRPQLKASRKTPRLGAWLSARPRCFPVVGVQRPYSGRIEAPAQHNSMNDRRLWMSSLRGINGRPRLHAPRRCWGRLVPEALARGRRANVARLLGAVCDQRRSCWPRSSLR